MTALRPDPGAAPVASASVVVCCHDERRLPALGEAVGSVLSQLGPGDEVVVVVDHNPALLARVAALFPAAAVLPNGGPRGLSGARNTGVAASTGELVVFLDDDAVAEPGTIAAVKRLAAPALVLGVAGHVEPDWLGGRPAWFPSEFLWVVGCTYEGMRPGPVRNAIGALMAIKRSVLEAAGAFRTELGRGASRLPLGCEETELCMRAARRFPGHWFVYADEVACAHKVPPARATWGYLLTRCWAEGLSKASLTAQAVTLAGLGTERHYATRTLPAGVTRGLGDAARGDPWGMLRATAIVLGFLVTAVAYALGRARLAAGGRLAPLLDRGGAHVALLSSAGALATGTLATAVLGFAYWWVAARSFSPRAVGYASAAISIMNLLAHVGEFGMGPLLLGYLPRHRGDTAATVSTALAGVLASCALAGLACLGLDALFHFGLGAVLEGWAAALVFVVAVATTGFALVLDQVLVSLTRSRTQMWRNVVFAGGKLLLLAALAATVPGAGEAWIFATWFVGQTASLLWVAPLAGGGQPFWRRPRLALLRPLAGDVLGHHALNIALQAPALLLPFVVTVVLSPETNAAFFAAWSLVNVALLVPASLTTVLYSATARDPHLLASRLRLSLALSGALGLGTGLGLLLFSPVVLGLFSPAYPLIAGTGLKALGFGVLGVAVKYHYVALQRFAGRLGWASVALAVGCALEIGCAVAGGWLGGLTGLMQGWVAAVFLQALAMAPTVAAALRPDREPSASLVPPSHKMEAA